MIRFIKKYSFRIISWIVVICCFLYLYQTCGGGIVRYTNKEYIYSKDSLNCVTIIQYMNLPLEIIGDLTQKDIPYAGNRYAGIYFIPGKFKGRLPKDNYIFLDYTGFSYYFKWKNDTTYLVLQGLVKENKLDTTKVLFRKEFTREEKIEHGYYNADSKEFKDYTSKEYQRLSRYNLKQW